MFPETSTLSKLIRHRPAVVEILEASGHPFWNHAEQPVESFCRLSGMNPSEIFHMAASAPLPHPASNWNEERLYRVVDFLTSEHRHFREVDLPAFNHLISAHVQDSAENHGMKFAVDTLASFTEDFLTHLRDEEENVFPYILRLEQACLFGREAEFRASQRSSVNPLTRMDRICEQHLDRVALDAGRLGEAMRDFRRRLIQHSRIETLSLFPRARVLEKKLAARRSVSIPAEEGLP